jgi:esterase/lipase superfamily enzyme
MSALAVGCSERVTGVLVPYAGTVSGTNIVDMLVVTTRGPEDVQPGMMFSGARGTQLGFADISVSIQPASARNVGEVQ